MYIFPHSIHYLNLSSNIGICFSGNIEVCACLKKQ